MLSGYNTTICLYSHSINCKFGTLVDTIKIGQFGVLIGKYLSSVFLTCISGY